MDTFIGNFQLTQNQISNLGVTNLSPFKGFKYEDETGALTAVSDSQPSQQDIDDLVSAINSASDTLLSVVCEGRFNVDLMTKRIGDVIDDAREIALMPYLGGIQSSAKAKNWTKLKNLINGLGQLQIATAQEVLDIKDVIAEQGIILDNY